MEIGIFLFVIGLVMAMSRLIALLGIGDFMALTSLGVVAIGAVRFLGKQTDNWVRPLPGESLQPVPHPAPVPLFKDSAASHVGIASLGLDKSNL